MTAATSPQARDIFARSGLSRDLFNPLMFDLDEGLVTLSMDDADDEMSFSNSIMHSYCSEVNDRLIRKESKTSSFVTILTLTRHWSPNSR